MCSDAHLYSAISYYSWTKGERTTFYLIRVKAFILKSMTEYVSWYKLTSSFIYRKSACPNSSRIWLKKKSLGLTTFEWKILFINRPYLVKHLSTHTTTFLTVPAKSILISISKFQIIPITHVKYMFKKKKTRIHILLQSLISDAQLIFDL